MRHIWVQPEPSDSLASHLKLFPIVQLISQVQPELVLRCGYCGVSFDDEIVFSIHRGWHNHSNPSICNMCGEECSSRHGFYCHLSRFHNVTF